MTFKCSGIIFANLAWYRLTKNLVPFLDPKVHLFENSSLKIKALLHCIIVIRIKKYTTDRQQKDRRITDGEMADNSRGHTDKQTDSRQIDKPTNKKTNR